MAAARALALALTGLCAWAPSSLASLALADSVREARGAVAASLLQACRHAQLAQADSCSSSSGLGRVPVLSVDELMGVLRAVRSLSKVQVASCAQVCVPGGACVCPCVSCAGLAVLGLL